MANEKIVPPGLHHTYDQFLSLVNHVKSLPTGKNNILICGDTGVGKSLFTELSEKVLDYPTDKIKRVNIAAFNSDLIESELFGHKKGAYTGATTNRDGFIKKADGGLLIVEEIGEIPKPIQAKFLTFIEDGYFYHLGDETEQTPEVQIIATTNQPKSNFREDFWQRFIIFKVPPIYERRNDILYYLFAGYSHILKSLRKWEVLTLLAYNWPGNVREIEHLGVQIEWAQRLMITERGSEEPVNEFSDTEFNSKHGPDIKYRYIFYTLSLLSQDNLTIEPNIFNEFKSNLYESGFIYDEIIKQLKSKRTTLLSDINKPAFTKNVGDEIDYDQDIFEKYNIKHCKINQELEKVEEEFAEFCNIFQLYGVDNNNLLNIDKCEINSGYLEELENFKTFGLKRANEFYGYKWSKKEYELRKAISEFRLGKDKGNLNNEAHTEKDIMKNLYKKRLEEFNGNISKTADSLGLNRTTFNARLKKFPDLKEYAIKLRI